MEVEPDFKEMVRILVGNGIPLESTLPIDREAVKASLADSGILPKTASAIVRIVEAGTQLGIDWLFLEDYDRNLLQSTLHKLTMLRSETVSSVLDLLYEAVAPPASDSIPTLRFAMADGVLNVFGTDVEEPAIEIPEQVRIDGGLHDVTVVGTRAFWGCTILSRVAFPETITHIGRNAFWGCTSIMFLELPGTLRYIGPDSFSRCSGLTSLEIPDSVEEIASNAFSSCTALKRVVIPASVKRIGDGAFKHCTNLESVEIPGTLEAFGTDVFEGCPFLDEESKARIADIQVQ